MWTYFILAGKSIISNDGATILKNLDIVHPAAKTLVDIAKSQDAEVMLFSPSIFEPCSQNIVNAMLVLTTKSDNLCFLI